MEPDKKNYGSSDEETKKRIGRSRGRKLDSDSDDRPAKKVVPSIGKKKNFSDSSSDSRRKSLTRAQISTRRNKKREVSTIHEVQDESMASSTNQPNVSADGAAEIHTDSNPSDPDADRI